MQFFRLQHFDSLKSQIKNDIHDELGQVSKSFSDAFELQNEINEIFSYQLVVTIMNLFIEVSFSTFFYIIHLIEQHTENAAVRLYSR